MTLRAASCFSGIGAPEVAMPHWDWLWCAEIEKFPSAVMAARHPDSVNLGDVTADDFMQRATSFGQIDVLAGGPPCQAFSVAGLRKSMDDDRGNLSLRFVKIAHAIRPRNLLVENVPGWLNTPDNAFGCFLGAILGSDDALHSPADGKWPRTGMASGPLGRLCWATLDAQYFGLAQRRQRVFVVVDFGNGADPASVLFEPESLLRHSPPSRSARKDVAGTIAARTTGGGGLGTDFDLDGGLVSDTLEASAGRSRGAGTPTSILCADVAPTLDSHFGDKMGLENQHINGGGACSLPSVAMCLNAGAMQRLDPTFETLIPTNRCDFDDADLAHTLKGEGFDASEDGTGRGTPLVPEIRAVAPTLTGNYGTCSGEGILGTLTADSPSGGGCPLPAIAYRTSGNCGAWETGDKTDALTTSTDPNSHVIAFWSKDSGNDATVGLSPTMRAMNSKESNQNAGGQLAIAVEEPIVLMERGREGGSNLEHRQDGTSNAILTPNGGRGGLGVGAIAIQAGALRENPNSGPDGIGVQSDIAYTMEARSEVQAVAFAENQQGAVYEMDVFQSLNQGGGKPCQSYPAVRVKAEQAWSVRRLTPVECARLQGFPDDYLDIIFRKKPAADGNKYKALGNSWAVPNGRWIMERIERFMP